MDKESLIKKAKTVFKKHAEVKLAYLFGSAATGKIGPLSDYDFAVYLDERDVKKSFEIKAKLFSELSLVFKTDKIDVIILDTTESPELKYAVIKEGILLVDREPFKVLIEPKILNEYFDFVTTLRQYNLTSA